MKAYILVKLDPGREMEFYEAVTNFEGVSMCDVLHGSYDVIVVIEGDKKNVDQAWLKIRKMPHVIETNTLTAIELS